MKQLKFLKMITLDGKPIWHEGCLYDIVDENGTMYKLFSEDLQLRGIDKKLEDIFYKVVEIQQPKQIEKKEIKKETKKSIKF